MCCLYICARICPDGPIFSAVELDDIRIGRVQETENTLQQQIEGLQSRLTLQRMKRTNLETQRDIAATVEERVNNFNSKGESIYGDAWEGKDGGTVPIKELVTIPESEIRDMRIAAQNIVTARKAEEEKDVWKIWNQFKDDPNKKDAGGPSGNISARSTGVSSATDQPDVLTGRTNRAGKTASSTSADPRFNSRGPSAQARSNIKPIPPPRKYEVPVVGKESSKSVSAAPRPAAGRPLRGPPRSDSSSFARQPGDEKEDYDSKIHSNFHSPPPRSISDRVPLLAAQHQKKSEKKPPPPLGPPPGWRGSQDAASNGAVASTPPPSSKPTGTNNVSPPFAPAGVLPPRGTPPPSSIKQSSRSSKKQS